MKKILLSLVMLLSVGLALGQDAHVKVAREAAQRATRCENLRLLQSSPATNNVFCFVADDGILVIATSDKDRPILGYSRTPIADGRELPPALTEWLQEVDQQLESGSVDHYAENGRKDLPDSVAPLITSTWRQYGQGYNSLVPADSVIAADSTMARFQGHPTVGCAALAMAQVMRYWHYPLHGIGSNSYSYEGYSSCWRYGTVSADFGGATYIFDSMPDRLTDSSTDAQRFQVAQLLFHCGVASFMSYNVDCQGSSGSNAQYQLNGLVDNFGYNSDARLVLRNEYSATEWLDLMRTEVAEGRPVLFAAYSIQDDSLGTQSVGHAFIVDGYDTAGLVHVNWGWGGSCDGYYDLPILRPVEQYRFAHSQMAIVGLDTNQGTAPRLRLAEDLTMTSDTVYTEGYIRANYAVTNTGIEPFDGYVGAAVYTYPDGQFSGYADGRHVTITSDDTIRVSVHQHMELAPGRYQLLMQYCYREFSPETTQDITIYFADAEHSNMVIFDVVEGEEVGVETPETEHPGVYPNPATTRLSVNQLPDDCRVTLVDMQGRVVRSTKACQNTDIDVSGLARGAYLLSVASDKGTTVQKVVLR